jgi:hypothetical protein
MRLSLVVAFAVSLGAISPAAARAQDAPARGPRVHVVADSPAVTLYEQTFDDGVARPICQPPCDRVIDARPGRGFFFTGEGLRPSRPFFVNDRTRDLWISVDTGVERRTSSAVMVAVGIVGLAGSVGTFLWGLSMTGEPNKSGTPIALGITGAAFSLTLSIVGIVSLSRRTTTFELVKAKAAASGIGFRF